MRYSLDKMSKRISYLLFYSLFYCSIVMTGENTMALLIESEVFTHEGIIPKKYTCEGEDISPDLYWIDPPAGTKSFALIVDDPDAPDPKAPKMTYVHWVLYNIPATATALQENVGSKLPLGTLQGLNDKKQIGYTGPCPPIGAHRYFFKLYALDTVLPDLNQPTKAQLEAAMKGHILDKNEIMGIYEKDKK